MMYSVLQTQLNILCHKTDGLVKNILYLKNLSELFSIKKTIKNFFINIIQMLFKYVVNIK